MKCPLLLLLLLMSYHIIIIILFYDYMLNFCFPLFLNGVTLIILLTSEGTSHLRFWSKITYWGNSWNQCDHSKKKKKKKSAVSLISLLWAVCISRHFYHVLFPTFCNHFGVLVWHHQSVFSISNKTPEALSYVYMSQKKIHMVSIFVTI